MTHTEGVRTVSTDTIATIVSIVLAFGALAAFMDRKIDGLRTEFRQDLSAMRAELSALNDKVFALAAGLKPRIEQHEK